MGFVMRALIVAEIRKCFYGEDFKHHELQSSSVNFCKLKRSVTVQEDSIFGLDSVSVRKTVGK